MRQIRLRANLAAVAILLTVAACAERAPDLTPSDILLSQANEAVVALGMVQRAAIELNKVQVCELPLPCRDLLSDNNTRIVINVVEDGVNLIQAIPDGWKATALAAMDQVEQRVDAAGKVKLASYIAAGRAVINAIVGSPS